MGEERATGWASLFKKPVGQKSPTITISRTHVKIGEKRTVKQVLREMTGGVKGGDNGRLLKMGDGYPV